MSITVGGRLKALSGLSGATVGQMLQAIGSGATMAQCLRNYSGLSGVTMAAHLLVERAVAPAPSGGDTGGWPAFPIERPRRPREEDVALLLAVLH